MQIHARIEDGAYGNGGEEGGDDRIGTYTQLCIVHDNSTNNDFEFVARPVDPLTIRRIQSARTHARARKSGQS